MGLWGYQVVPPWQALSASWAYIAGRGDPTELLNLVCLLGFSLLALFALRRLPLAYALYLWPSLALLYTRVIDHSPLASVSRYTLVLFPCFVLLAIWLARRPWLAAGWLVIGGLLEAFLLAFTVRFGFVA